MRGVTALLVTMAALVLSGLGCKKSNESPEKAVGNQASSFTLEDQDGKKVSLSDFSGKIVVLEWTNPQCPFVLGHYKAGTMKRLAETYAPQGVVWLAIHSSNFGTNEMNKAWVESQQLPYPVLNDSSGQVGKAYGAVTTPHMFIVSGEGMIVYQGAIDDKPSSTPAADAKNHVDQALTELLAGKPVSTPSTKPYGCTVKYAK